VIIGTELERNKSEQKCQKMTAKIRWLQRMTISVEGNFTRPRKKLALTLALQRGQARKK
jgi:hypothetical protein